jgi:hypothetical protein
MQTTVRDKFGRIRRYHDAPITHGTVVGYGYWQCRCPKCREARRAYRLAMRRASRGLTTT